MQHVTHRAVGGPSVRTVLAADVDGELRGVGCAGVDPPPRCARSSVTSPRDIIADDLVGQRPRSCRRCPPRRRRSASPPTCSATGRCAVHGAGRSWRCRAARRWWPPRCRRRDRAARRRGTDRRAQALAEVCGELEVVGHSPAPIHWPSHAAARPSATLTAMLANADQTCRSSPRRWVSSIHVEKVV